MLLNTCSQRALLSWPGAASLGSFSQMRHWQQGRKKSDPKPGKRAPTTKAKSFAVGHLCGLADRGRGCLCQCCQQMLLEPMWHCLSLWQSVVGVGTSTTFALVGSCNGRGWMSNCVAQGRGDSRCFRVMGMEVKGRIAQRRGGLVSAILAIEYPHFSRNHNRAARVCPLAKVQETGWQGSTRGWQGPFCSHRCCCQNASPLRAAHCCGRSSPIPLHPEGSSRGLMLLCTSASPRVALKGCDWTLRRGLL